MKTTVTVPMDSLVQRIADQQSELESLRKEFEARQARLERLKTKREDLEARLRGLDAEIEAVNQGKTRPRGPVKPIAAKPAPAPGAVASAPNPVKPTAAKPAPASGAGASAPKKMIDWIMEIVSEAPGPLTPKEIANELQRRGFPTTSNIFPRIVQARLYELVTKGILQRATGQPGVVLGKSKPSSNAQPGRAGSGQKETKKTVPARKSSGGKDKPKKTPLRSIVAQILGKSQRPMAARELAQRVQAHGYETKSKDLTNVMWVMLGKMDNVENVPGEGYRLKQPQS
jgi:Fe2+ or Zn2+ uptake regulation protein